MNNFEILIIIHLITSMVITYWILRTSMAEAYYTGNSHKLSSISEIFTGFIPILNFIYYLVKYRDDYNFSRYKHIRKKTPWWLVCYHINLDIYFKID